jgi:hypothetical protein
VVRIHGEAVTPEARSVAAEPGLFLQPASSAALIPQASTFFFLKSFAGALPCHLREKKHV